MNYEWHEPFISPPLSLSLSLSALHLALCPFIATQLKRYRYRSCVYGAGGFLVSTAQFLTCLSAICCQLCVAPHPHTSNVGLTTAGRFNRSVPHAFQSFSNSNPSYTHLQPYTLYSVQIHLTRATTYRHMHAYNATSTHTIYRVPLPWHMRQTTLIYSKDVQTIAIN